MIIIVFKRFDFYFNLIFKKKQKCLVSLLKREGKSAALLKWLLKELITLNKFTFHM